MGKNITQLLARLIKNGKFELTDLTLDEITALKFHVVNDQDYEFAAKLRDAERTALEVKEEKRQNEIKELGWPLMPMIEYILEQDRISWNIDIDDSVNYAKFVKQKVEMGMFIPVSRGGLILKDPTKIKYEVGADALFEGDLKQYNAAKQNVIFIDKDWRKKDADSITNGLMSMTFKKYGVVVHHGNKSHIFKTLDDFAKCEIDFYLVKALAFRYGLLWKTEKK